MKNYKKERIVIKESSCICFIAVCITKSMRIIFISQIAAISPGSGVCGRGPCLRRAGSTDIIEAPGQRVINLSAYQTSHAQTNYGVFDQYLTKTKTTLPTLFMFLFTFFQLNN